MRTVSWYLQQLIYLPAPAAQCLCPLHHTSTVYSLSFHLASTWTNNIKCCIVKRVSCHHPMMRVHRTIPPTRAWHKTMVRGKARRERGEIRSVTRNCPPLADERHASLVGFVRWSAISWIHAASAKPAKVNASIWTTRPTSWCKPHVLFWQFQRRPRSDRKRLDPATRFLVKRLDQIAQSIEGINASISHKGRLLLPPENFLPRYSGIFDKCALWLLSEEAVDSIRDPEFLSTASKSA